MMRRQLLGWGKWLFDVFILKGTELLQENQKSKEKGTLWQWCFPLLEVVWNSLKDQFSGMWLYLGVIYASHPEFLGDFSSGESEKR